MPLQVTGLGRTRARLRRLAQAARDVTPFWAAEEPELRAVIDRAIATTTSPGGQPWPADQDGASEATGQTENVQLRAAANELRVRVPTAHASFQLFGTATVPARNFLPFERLGSSFKVPKGGVARSWFAALKRRLHAYLVAAAAREGNG